MKKTTTFLCALFTLSVFAHESKALCSHLVANQSDTHSLNKISTEALLLAIEDGSQWEFSQADIPTASSWNLHDELVISPNSSYFSYFSFYKYTISNATKGTSIVANLYHSPEIDGQLTKQVKNIDVAEAEVTLTDHSSWLVSTYYESKIHQWQPLDYIIVGTSNNPKKNILINVNLNQYIEVANCN